ncbi:ArgP/LysG family DNA-binding transcriptional regulator [Corynebacterium sp. S7]
MDQVKMTTLATIIDEGSFEAAADVLGISPSAVSQRVKALEHEAGRVLLHRTIPVTATQAGEVVVQAAKRMSLLQAETDAKLTSRLARVPLDVAVNADSLATWFQPVLGEVARMGNASLRLRVEDESLTLDLLRRGDVMGAVTRESTPVSGCTVSELGSMRFVAVAAPQLVEDGIDFARMPVLRGSPADGYQDQVARRHLAQGQRVERGESMIPTSQAFIEALVVGLGWGLLPLVQAQPLIDENRLLVIDEEPVDVALYWQRWRLESDLLRELTEVVLRAGKALDA